MKRPCVYVLFLAASLTISLHAQISDRCSPGWSTLNRVREQLTPDIDAETLKLLHLRIQRELAACPDNPDLWHYRALVANRLKDAKDYKYANDKAKERGSEALLAGVNPFAGIRETAPAVLSTKIHDTYALVVGINQFQNTGSLQYAANDATSFGDALMNLGKGSFQEDHVFRLLNEKATLNGVRTAIGRIRARAQPDDLVVVYIASHGSPRKSDPNGVSYILMHDTKVDTPANVYATSLQMIDLVDLLRRDIQASRLVLILDTYYSGDATGGKSKAVYSADKSLGAKTDFSAAADRFEDKNSMGRARVVITASRADEPSREDAKLGHGYFTYFLLEALKNNGGNRSLGDLFQSVHDRVVHEVRDRLSASQTPTIRSSPEGLKITLGDPIGG